MSKARVKEFKKAILEQIGTGRHGLTQLRALEQVKCAHDVAILVPCFRCWELLGDKEYKKTRKELVNKLLRENGLERAVRRMKGE